MRRRTSAFRFGRELACTASVALLGCADSPASPPTLASITVAPAEISLEVGETKQMSATLLDEKGAPIAEREVDWTSSRPSVARVEGTGLVVAVSPGEATISAYAAGKVGTASVVVRPKPVAVVKIFPDTLTLEVGETRTLGAGAYDSDLNLLVGRPFSWSSSDNSVVTVDQLGSLTAVGIGTASVTVAAEGKTATAEVTVVNAPTIVSGIIRESTTWTRDKSPYHLNGEVQVATGVIVTIEPGVRVLSVGDPRVLRLWGEIRAVGNANAEIVLEGFHIVAAMADVVLTLEHSHLKEIYIQSKGSELDLTVRNSTVEMSALMTDRSTGTWTFERNRFDLSGILIGWYSDPREVVIRNNAFIRNSSGTGGDGSISLVYMTTPPANLIIERNSFLDQSRPALNLSSSASGMWSLPIDARYNYWGTADESVIETLIFDKNDDLRSPGFVEFKPFLTAPDPATPTGHF